MKCHHTFSSVLLLAAVFAPQAYAQSVVPEPLSVTRGLMISGSATGASLKAGSSSDFDGGRGGGLTVGFGFSDSWTFFLSGDGATMTSQDGSGTYGLGFGDLGLRWHFGTGSRAVPYLEGSYTARAAKQSMYINRSYVDVEMKGTGWSGGAGLMVYLTPHAAIDLAALYTTGDFTEATANGQSVPSFPALSATGARVRIGLTAFIFDK